MKSTLAISLLHLLGMDPPAMSSEAGTKRKICVVGGGNAAHALAALFPYQGHDVTMFCPYKDQADLINQGLKSQGGFMHAEFAAHNAPSGLVKGAPKLVSREASAVIPDADIIVMPLPSFTYADTLRSIKDHLRPGQIICVTPGQGSFDWYAREILGDDLAQQITILGVMPMPFNCRIEDYGTKVNVQEFKKSYTIGVSPATKLEECKQLVKDLFGPAESAGNGSFLECTMYPINAIIHPARLYTLLSDWRPGMALPENPLFYEDFTEEAATMMDNINKELIAIAEALTKQGVGADVPHIFDWLAVYVYNEPKNSNLQKFFQTNDAYKGFRCPLIKSNDGNGFVPDFTNRYFTEDINLGLCGYKGLAEIAQVKTPVCDRIILWAQSYMGVEFLVDGRLCGKDLHITNAPQRFGYKTMEDLRKMYPASTQ